MSLLLLLLLLLARFACAPADRALPLTLPSLRPLWLDGWPPQVLRNREDDSSRGYGFVSFTHPSFAQAAMHHLNGQVATAGTAEHGSRAGLGSGRAHGMMRSSYRPRRQERGLLRAACNAPHVHHAPVPSHPAAG